MKNLSILVLALALVTPLAAAANTFDTVLEHYEAVRTDLFNDTMPDAKTHGEAIAQLIGDLEKNWDVAKAGVPAAQEDSAKADEVKALLPEISAAASDLAAATDVASAREAFYAVTKPLVRYWGAAATSGERPVVAFCPMAKKSWLQPKGEIENPYYGQSMARCGSVVDE